MLKSRWILLIMRNVSDKRCGETQNTLFIFSQFFRKSCLLWDSVAKYGSVRRTTDVNIICSMCVACWITKATDTHSEYVTLIAFPRHLWLSESSLLLRYTYSTLPLLLILVRRKGQEHKIPNVKDYNTQQKLAKFHYVRPSDLMALLSSQKDSYLSVLVVCCPHTVLSNTELQDVTWATLRKTRSLLLYVKRSFQNTWFGQA